jgi:hypothetical protein
MRTCTNHCRSTRILVAPARWPNRFALEFTKSLHETCALLRASIYCKRLTARFDAWRLFTRLLSIVTVSGTAMRVASGGSAQRRHTPDEATRARGRALSTCGIRTNFRITGNRSESSRRILGELGESMPHGQAFAELLVIQRSTQQMSLKRESAAESDQSSPEMPACVCAHENPHTTLTFAREVMTVLGPVVNRVAALANACLSWASSRMSAFAAG